MQAVIDFFFFNAFANNKNKMKKEKKVATGIVTRKLAGRHDVVDEALLDFGRGRLEPDEVIEQEQCLLNVPLWIYFVVCDQ